MKKCSTGCGRNGVARGMCRTCYQRARRNGELAAAPKANRDRSGGCSFSGCGRTVKARGLCSGHYAQQAAGQELRPLLLPGGQCGLDGCTNHLGGRNTSGFCDDHRRLQSRVTILCGAAGCARVLRAATNTTGLCVDHAPVQHNAERRATLARAWFEQVDRVKVWARDGGICHLCGLPADESWQLDHVVPLAAGGAHSYQNAAVSHASCNAGKRDRHSRSARGLLGAFVLRPVGCQQLD